MVAVVEHINRLARQNLLGEDKQRHIRPAPGTIHGKEPQAGGGQVVQVAVGMGHQLIGLLGGRVQAQGVVYVVMHGERHGFVSAVYRAAGGVHQVLHVVMAAAFKDIHKANQVGLYVGVGVLQGIAYAGLGGQVHHPFGFVFPEQGFHGGTVCYVLAYLSETGLAGEPCQTRFFEVHVVIVVNVVHADDFITAIQQSMGQMGADKAGGSGNEDFQDLFSMKNGARGRLLILAQNLRPALTNGPLSSMSRLSSPSS